VSDRRFDFIVDDEALRINLNRTFELIYELLLLSEAPQYPADVTAGFRKTIVIYSGSVIEALLLLTLRHHTTEKECAELEEKIGKRIYHISNTEHIAIVTKKRQKLLFSKLNLGQINTLCKKHKLISTSLYKAVDQIREMRNTQHLGGLLEIERSYTQTDIDMAFSTASTVAHIAKETYSS